MRNAFKASVLGAAVVTGAVLGTGAATADPMPDTGSATVPAYDCQAQGCGFQTGNLDELAQHVLTLHRDLWNTITGDGK